jgi:superfamily II DNA or RNA helicase
MSITFARSDIPFEDRKRITEELTVVVDETYDMDSLPEQAAKRRKLAGSRFSKGCGAAFSSQALQQKLCCWKFDPKSDTIALPMSYAATRFDVSTADDYDDENVRFSDTTRKELACLSFARRSSSTQRCSEKEGEAFCFVPREHQVSILLESFHRLSSRSSSSRCVTIEAGTGSGKTMMAICLAASLGMKTVIIHPGISIGEQWKNSLMKMFPNEPDPDKSFEIVGSTRRLCKKKAADHPPPRVGETEEEEEVVLSDDDDEDAADFSICLAQRSGKMSVRKRRQIGTVIVDEAHMHCNRTGICAMLSFSPVHLIILTATLQKENGTHKVIHLFAGKGESIKYDAERKYRVFHHISRDEPIANIANEKTGTLDFGKMCKAAAECKMLNDDIVRMAIGYASGTGTLLPGLLPNGAGGDSEDSLSARRRRRKVIVFTKLVSHAEKLVEAIRSTDSAADTKVSLFTGKQKSADDASIVVGTNAKLGTGFDPATCLREFSGDSFSVLIITPSVKQWQNWKQFVGRLMRSGGGGNGDNEEELIVIVASPKCGIFKKHMSDLVPFILSSGGEFIGASSSSSSSRKKKRA